MIGRIVHYSLSSADVEAIQRRRTSPDTIARMLQENPPQWPRGAQAHVGNPVTVGDVLPLLVTASTEGAVPSVNGKVMLDGSDVLWVAGRVQGPLVGQWAWPQRT